MRAACTLSTAEAASLIQSMGRRSRSCSSHGVWCTRRSVAVDNLWVRLPMDMLEELSLGLVVLNRVESELSKEISKYLMSFRRARKWLINRSSKILFQVNHNSIASGHPALKATFKLRFRSHQQVLIPGCNKILPCPTNSKTKCNMICNLY